MLLHSVSREDWQRKQELEDMIKSPLKKPVLMHLQLVAGAAEGRNMDHVWALRRLVPCSTELRLTQRHRQQEAQALVVRMLEEARDQSPGESGRVSYPCSKAATTALSCFCNRTHFEYQQDWNH